MTLHFPFENTYARLPERFYARVAPTPVQAPRLIRLNTQLALDLGLDPNWLAGPQGLEVLAGRSVPDSAEPIATAYAGHQFGHFVPQLGDGRAILLGEIVDRQGVRRDVQLKGSGPTPFSRRGDGRAALGPVLREYIVSEAMTALGIPSTRSLAAVMSGETVVRETPLPGRFSHEWPRAIFASARFSSLRPVAISTAFVSSQITSSPAITLRPVRRTAHISHYSNWSRRDRQSSLRAGCSLVSFTAS